MRVLLVTDIFEGPDQQPWLLDDLANCLLGRGHQVDVLVSGPTRPQGNGEQPGTPKGMRVFNVSTSKPRLGSIAKLAGYLEIGLKLHSVGSKWVAQHEYDLCLYTSIACFSWGLPSRVRRRGGARQLLLFLWDFFPIHQIEIGRISHRWSAWIMKSIEAIAFRRADFVALMSPANTAFFHRYHPKAINRTLEIPPWSTAELPVVTHRDSAVLRVVFGGQLAKGRGIDALLDCCSILRDEDGIEIIVAGDGPDRARLEASAAARGLTNVSFLGGLPRPQYRALAETCDVGVAVTVAGISPPSFPSKIIEYCRMGLPVLVCTEDSSDAGRTVEAAGAGLSVAADDPGAMATALRQLRAAQLQGGLVHMSGQARRLFEERFSVVRVAERLERLVNES